MGHFSEETLRKFNEMCSEGLNFDEGNSYDFARCVKADGEIYGISPGETCRGGKQIPDKKKGEPKAKPKGDSSRLAKLKIAFMKKLGRQMTSQELTKARNLVATSGASLSQITKGQTKEDSK